jgi:ABC-2 type transport system ATP-binding protein
VFDEPLSGLDVTTGLVFKSLIKALARQGKTILYSSHVLEVVEKVCTSVIILRKGIMVANDSVEHLRDLMELPSLEDIFSELVLQEDTEKIAEDIVEVMQA